MFLQALIVAALPLAADEHGLNYPEARRVDQVDVYHSREVADPYRWLEEDPRESDEVSAWIAAQNEVTRAVLDAIPARERIRKRLTDLWDYQRYSAPWQVAGKYFYFKNDGLQNQAVLYVADDYADEGRVLIDPNAWSKDGTIALGRTAVSDDGRRLAYLRKEAGSDWATVRVIDVDTGTVHDDVLEWSRHGNMVWNAAGDGFYYIRYPEPPPGEKYQALSLNPGVYFHQLGDPQEEDELVYRRPDHPRWSFWLERTDDNRYLVLTIFRSTDPQTRVYVREVATPDADWHPLIDDFENEFRIIGNDANRLIFLTDLDAPTKRIVAMDALGGGRGEAEEVVPAGEGTLEEVSLLDGKLICQYIDHVVSKVRAYGIDGQYHGDVELPGIGRAAGFSGRQDDQETFFSFANYVTPSAIYRFDVHLGHSEQVRSSQIDFDPTLYASEQYFFESKDGTRIPIIVSHRRGVEKNGKNPTLLYGYGGFSISLMPRFSVDYAAWMDLGGIVAVANLRGGGEYGETWHAAGKKTNKQNVFDDFIAAAEWLIAEQYTSTEKLAVMGGSNGGLLVGAVMTQRPELFAACLPAVGVMDMLRYNQFTAGHFWRDEYGTTDNADEFAALVAYSPLPQCRTRDAIIPRRSSPRLTRTTAWCRCTVLNSPPRLQHAQAGDAPVLLRVESRAGHGAGTPISKRIDYTTDKWAFLWEGARRWTSSRLRLSKKECQRWLRCKRARG